MEEKHSFGRFIPEEEKNGIIKGYKLLKEKGSGGFGTVYEGIKDNQPFAIKKMSKIKLFDYGRIPKNDQEKVLKPLINEVKSMIAVKDSQYFVKFYENFETNDNLYIVMELCDVTLKEFFYRLGRPMKKAEILKVFSDVNKALELMEKKKLVHRDLKGENILLKVKNGEIEASKIADMGNSRLINQTFSTMGLGTTDYMAPELFADDKQNELSRKVDIWSVGVILYELSTGKLPFSSKITEKFPFKKTLMTIENIKNEGYKIDYNDIVDKDLKDLLEKIFKRNPSERIDLKSYLDDKYWGNTITEKVNFKVRKKNNRLVPSKLIKIKNKKCVYLFIYFM